MIVNSLPWKQTDDSVVFEIAPMYCILDSVGEGQGGMIWENGIETCIISYVK